MMLDSTIPENFHCDAADLDNADIAERFGQSGCLQIDNFLQKEKIAAMADAFTTVFDNAVKDGAFVQVGKKRLMIPVPVEGLFNDPAIYSSPQLSGLLERILGPEYCLSCFTCVNALPGAHSQHLHKDYEGLFGTPVDHFAPSYAVNLFIPLVDLNPVNGTTRLWPGSHRKPDLDTKENGGVFPQVPTGSTMLMDYRILHEGTPNRSAFERPILVLAFSRNWFLDARHFNSINPLVISPETFGEMNEADQVLFSRAKIYRKLV